MKWSVSYCFYAMTPIFLIFLLIPLDELMSLFEPRAMCYMIAVSAAGYVASQGESFREKLACAEKVAWISGAFAAMIGVVRTLTFDPIVTGAIIDTSAILVGLAISVLPLMYAAGIALLLTPLKYTDRS